MSPLLYPNGVSSGGLSVSLSGFGSAGSYYFPPETTPHTTSAVLGNGTMRATPIIIPRSVTLVRIGAEVTVVGDAGSLVRLGIYADDGTGRPNALILDAGTIAGDSATVQEIVINTTLSPGRYYLGGVVQNVTVTQPTVVVITGSLAVNWEGTVKPGANAAEAFYFVSGMTGALFGMAGAGASSVAPRVFVRTA